MSAISTMYSYIQSRKMVLYSHQYRIQELQDHINYIKSRRVSERLLVSMETEMLHEVQMADAITMETTAMEEDDSIRWGMSYQMEKYLAVVHSRLEQRGIYEIYSAAVLVQLLSGETIPIGIHMDQEVRTISYAFINQLGYPASTMERLTFLDSNGQSILICDTWKERYGVAEAIPVFYLYIHPDSEKDKDTTLERIHHILLKKRLRSLVTDQDLWMMYNDWNLVYFPRAEHNRNTQLLEFVTTYHFLFTPVKEQEQVKEKEQEQEQQEQDRLKEKAKLRMWCHLRDRNVQSITERMPSHDFQYKREIARTNLLKSMSWYPYFSLLDGSEDTLHNRFVLRYYFTVEELIHMGMKPELISADWWIAEWYAWSAMANQTSA